MAETNYRETPPTLAPDAPPSALRQLNVSNRRLERLLQNLRNEHDAESELRDIARDVVRAVDLNPDIALACILLCQIAGSYAVRHCIETAVVVVVLSRSLGKTDADTLTVTAAALTMNVGMLRHHESFQNKHTLSSEEHAIVRRHPEDSVDLLKCAGVEDEEWISCVLLHHENDDGSGYPAGVASPRVTLNAKLLSLADRYCAQVSARNYRKSVLPDRALRNLIEDKEAPVDPALARQFQRELGDYPPGCLVRLAGGEIGVVSHRLAGGEAPRVHRLRDAAGAPLAATPQPPASQQPASQRSASQQPASQQAAGQVDAIAEALSEDEAAIRFSMKQIWGVQASL